MINIYFLFREFVQLKAFFVKCEPDWVEIGFVHARLVQE